jgi:hypothetical protein
MIASLCHVCHDSDEMPAKKSLCSYCTYCHILLHIPLRQLFFKVCVCVCVCVFIFSVLGMENVMLSFGLLLLLPFQSVTPTFGVNSEIFQQS